MGLIAIPTLRQCPWDSEAELLTQDTQWVRGRAGAQHQHVLDAHLGDPRFTLVVTKLGIRSDQSSVVSNSL